MQFVLTIDLDRLPGDKAQEVARILRYWAGAMSDELLQPGQHQELMDSTWSPVGSWSVRGDG